MTPLGRRLERLSPASPWAVLAFTGGLLAVVAVWNYFREIQGIGPGVGPVVAAVMGVSLASGTVYAGYRLRESDLTGAERWVVVATGFGGGLFTATAYGLTLVVRLAEGRPLVEPLFPLLVVGGIGTLGGVVIGSEYVATRRLTEVARESRDAMAFTNNLLRHDVRNALQIIDGHATVLRNHDDDQVRESAETIRGQTDSLEQVISEVESVVDVLNGEVRDGTTDLSEVLDDAIGAVAAEQAGVTVDADVDGDLPVAGGDALYPVFSNLLGNAVEHGGDESVRIDVTARRDDDRVVVRVADDGPGIPEDVRERIFERGVSTDGGGYGLYVAQTVVERLSGDIRAEESDLGGAAFVVEVPLTARSDGGVRPVRTMTRVDRVTTDERLEDGFDVRRDVFIEEQGVSESEEMDGRDDEAAQFVAYDDDYPVGTARVRDPEEGVGKVERVAVREQYRRRGVGKAIMQRVERWANERGFDRLKLHAQTHVEGFYADLGYETTSGVFQEAGIDHVAMEKPLQDEGDSESVAEASTESESTSGSESESKSDSDLV